jgi:hypothetical protein
MTTNELLISDEAGPQVLMGMTGSSFEAAHQSHVERIEADADAMGYIARQVGFIATGKSIPPLAIIARDSGPARKMIGKWDHRLPQHEDDPDGLLFLAANHLTKREAPTFNRRHFVDSAKAVGASALTEISVASWEKGQRHAGDFVTGLLLAQRPLDLPPKPSLLTAAQKLLYTPRRALKAIDQIRADETMPEPFIVTHRER